MANFIGEFMYHKYGLHTLTDYHMTYVAVAAIKSCMCLFTCFALVQRVGVQHAIILQGRPSRQVL